MDAYRILVTGSRIWSDEQTLYGALTAAALGVKDKAVVIVHGHARKGADALADAWAQRQGPGVAVERHPAIWRPHGIYNPQAGLVRNRLMVRKGADICLAFIVGGSRGATHCAEFAALSGIPVNFYRE